MKKFLLFLLSISILTQANAGDFDKELGRVVMRDGVLEKGKYEKKPFTISSGDSELTIGASSTTEHRFAKNVVFLNSNIPDEFSYFRQTIDSKLGFAYGQNQFDHKAIEANTTLRFKTIWGKIGETGATEFNTIKSGNAIVGSHKHISSKPLIWVKEAWLKTTLNSIFNWGSEKLHSIKFGMFPFSLGRGISLGSVYGCSKDFLAIYSRITDYYAPGILLSGELSKDRLWYDLYYSKLEEKSASISDTFNSVKEKIVGRRTTPWRGVAKDSDLVAARLRIKPVKSDSFGELYTEPYFYYNEASDQKIEMSGDSKSVLGAIGLNSEYKKNNFEFGAEAALNYGYEQLYHLDRNAVTLRMVEVSAGVWALQEVYNKIVDTATGQIYMPVNDTNKSTVANNTNIVNGTPLSSDASWRNASDRYRNDYRNRYRGWFAVADASYLFESICTKFSAAAGYVSGDANPHISDADGIYRARSYNGFVTLNEFYVGKRVPSVIMLDDRHIKRPLTLIIDNNSEVKTDSAFSDLAHIGFGFDLRPKRLEEHNLSINPNVLFYWKAHKSPKYDLTTHRASTTEKADRYLGTEFNINGRYDLLKDLSLVGNLAFFISGQYYNDVKGAPLDSDFFNRLEKVDQASLDSANYRLGSDNAMYFRVALEYRF